MLIFEGDYIKDEIDDEIGVIEFDETCFWLTVDNIITPLSEYKISQLSIIGNIHDNPEMLKGKNT